MTITGKKIVVLSADERVTLQAAIDLLMSLSEAVGNDDYFDFDEISDTLHYIKTTDKFEIDFEQ